MTAGIPTATGVASFDDADAGLVPTAFVAVTTNVYTTPLERPVTTQAFVVVVHEKAPGEETTLYEVTADPPSDNGADHLTATLVSPTVATTLNGSVGAVAAARGVTVTVAEAGLIPY